MKGKEKKKTKKKKAGRWGKGLGGIYQVVNFIHRQRIFKLFKYVHPSLVAGLAHFFSKIFLGTSKRTKARIKKSLLLVTGKKYSKKFQGIITDTVLKHMSVLLFDIMLKAPNFTTKDYHKVVEFEDIKYLDEALAKGQGVLIPSVHVGQFFHNVAGLLLHPKQYEVAGVGNMANRLIFENVAVMPQYKNVHIVPRDKYGKVKQRLVHHLNKNRIVFLMHDIPRGSNLRTFFTRGKRELLVPTPQGIIALHLLTRAPIVPMVSIPDGRFTKSVVKFLNPKAIQAVSDKFWGAPAEKFHGEMSTAINEALFPYLVKYIHCWEEVMGANRLEEVIRFPKFSTRGELLDKIKAYLEKMIKNSYEPGRNDDNILEWLKKTWERLDQNLENDERDAKLPHKSFIRLKCEKAAVQIHAILKILENLFNKSNNDDIVRVVKDAIHELGELFPK